MANSYEHRSVFRSKEANGYSVAVSTERSAQPLGFLGCKAAWALFAASPLCEFEHRIHLASLREELGVYGELWEWHGDLVGVRVWLGRGRVVPRRLSGVMSFPASVLIGPVYSDGVPF